MIEELLNNIKQCRICDEYLPMGANPVMAAGKNSKIIVIGQAPGRVVHATNIPWNDKSGDNLRNWLGVTRDQFYDTSLFSLMPMGFCYPGTGKSGDLPPRKECAPKWHAPLIDCMRRTELVLLVGNYAQQYYLKKNAKSTLTETVHSFEDYLPMYLPLPHPSPRNNIWMAKNPWFSKEVIPYLRKRIKFIMNT